MSARSPAVILYDAAGNPLAVENGVAIPANTKGLLVHGKDSTGFARSIETQTDGKLVVATTLPQSPPGTTPFTFAVVEGELEVGPSGDVASPHDSLGPIITSGHTLTIQFVTAGTVGDPSEAGSKVSVYWQTSGPTNHLIERIYITGQTVTVQLPSASEARDGTAMVGDGTNTRLMVRRERVSTTAQEIDFVVRGYTEAP
jgi:hypothetical protein